MVSFIDKLKKGMGVEELEEESPKKPKISAAFEEKPQRKKVRKKIQKMEIKTTSLDEPEEVEEKEEEFGEEKIEIKEEAKEKKESPAPAEAEQWLGTEEGQLAIDVYQTENDLVIQSAIAGVNTQSIDVCLEKDVLTIKGCRRKPEEEKGDYFSQECFWGPFSREIILPAEVDPDKVIAKMRDGILTIRIPKLQREKKRRITVSA